MHETDTLLGRKVIYTDEDEITQDNVLEVLNDAMLIHSVNRSEIDYLYKYYRGDQPILKRQKDVRPEICNRIVENRANEIVSFKVGYLMGEPVQYVGRGRVNADELNTLNDFVFAEDKAAKDKELADWFTICGTSYRMILPDPKDEADESPFEIYTLDPRNAFVVYHSGLGNKPMMGVMVASFLDEKDYKDPAAYQPTASNTITVEFKVSERYPDFADKVAAVEQWWVDYVDTGISPEYDEKKDAEILAALRTNTLSPETDIEALIAEAEGLKKELDEISASTADKEKRLKTINDIIKEHAMGQFRDGDKKVEVKGSTYVWTVSRSETTSVDKDALKADGLLDKYSKKSETYRMTVK